MKHFYILCWVQGRQVWVMSEIFSDDQCKVVIRYTCIDNSFCEIDWL